VREQRPDRRAERKAGELLAGLEREQGGSGRFGSGSAAGTERSPYAMAIAESDTPRQDARKAEKEEQQARAWELWLECWTYRDIATELGGPDEDTVGRWVSAKLQNCGNADAPASRQHFDIWSFNANSRSYRRTAFHGATLAGRKAQFCGFRPTPRLPPALRHLLHGGRLCGDPGEGADLRGRLPRVDPDPRTAGQESS